MNIVQLVDIATKEVTNYQNLSPFGDNLQDMKLICPWIFATKYFDADTGLVDFGNRQYDSTIKQWTTKESDPRATVEDFYAYCNNNPLKFIDPDGLWRVNFSFAIPLGIGAARGAAQGAVGGIWGMIAGALIGAAAGLCLDAAQKNINDRNKEKLDNKRQKDQFDDAIKEIERQTGKTISEQDRRKLHDHITGRGYGYHEIVDEGFHLFDDRYKAN